MLSKVLSAVLGQTLAGQGVRLPFTELPKLMRELEAAGIRIEFDYGDRDYGRKQHRCLVLSNVRIDIE